MQTSAAFLGELITLQGAQHGSEEIHAEELGIGATAFLAEPDENLRGRRALADPSGEAGAQVFGASLLLHETGDFDNEPGGDVVH